MGQSPGHAIRLPCRFFPNTMSAQRVCWRAQSNDTRLLSRNYRDAVAVADGGGLVGLASSLAIVSRLVTSLQFLKLRGGVI
jgi:hypothetical protein